MAFVVIVIHTFYSFTIYIAAVRSTSCDITVTTYIGTAVAITVTAIAAVTVAAGTIVGSTACFSLLEAGAECFSGCFCLLPAYLDRAPLHYPDEEETRQSGECQQYSSKAEGWPGRFTPMVLQFPKECAYRVYDEFEADSIKEQDNGDLLVSAAMREDQWLIGYLLSFGTQVTILEPARLKETIARQAKLIYEKNKP